MGRKKWTAENWSLDVIPAYTRWAQGFQGQQPREVVITTCAILDAGLAEVISKRLCGPTHEIVDFLGADENGRAPAGSFGARIQLARLVGLIEDSDLAVLRKLKKLRNLMAHRVAVEADNPKITAAVSDLWDAFQPTLGVQVIFLDRVMKNDPTAISIVERDPEWAAQKHRVDEARAQWSEVRQSFLTLLSEHYGIEAEIPAMVPLVRILANRLGHVPEPVVRLLLICILAAYMSLFRHILAEVTPVEPLGLNVVDAMLNPVSTLDGAKEGRPGNAGSAPD